MSRPFTPQAERLAAKLDKSGPLHPYDPTLGNCHNFIGYVRPNGYGEIGRPGHRGGAQQAHRAAYELAHGVTLASKVDVCHSCDNRRCCNVAHLFTGTRKDNMQDCARKGRSGIYKRVLSDVDIDAIRMFWDARNPITGERVFSQQRLAKAFGLKTPSHVSLIVNRKIWVRPQTQKAG